MKFLNRNLLILAVFLLLIQQILSGCAMTASEDINNNKDDGLSDRYVFQEKCSKCHELSDIEAYPYSPKDWAKIVDLMLEAKEAEKYISMEEAKNIKGYLKRHFFLAKRDELISEETCHSRSLLSGNPCFSDSRFAGMTLSCDDHSIFGKIMLLNREVGKMEEKIAQNTISKREERLNRRDFVKYGLTIGKTVFIGGVLIGNFTGCTTASKQVKKTKIGKNTSIKFAYITDTHVTFTGRNGTSLFEESFNIFRDVIAQVKEMDDIDFILFGGDNINNTDPGTKGFDEFMNIMSGVEVPYFVQFGNRESSPIPPGEALSKEQYATKMKGHGLDTGHYWWSISPVPCLRILGLDTSIIDHDNGEIPQTELKWIREVITKYPHDMIVTLSHHLFLPTWGNRNIPEWKEKYLLKNYQEVNTILEAFPQVKMCLTGHHHISKIQTVSGLHYISSPATVQYPHAFRTITINRNEARLQFHQVRDQRIIELGKKFLLTSKNAEEYAGGKSDDILAYCHGNMFDNNVTLKFR